MPCMPRHTVVWHEACGSKSFTDEQFSITNMKVTRTGPRSTEQGTQPCPCQHLHELMLASIEKRHRKGSTPVTRIGTAA